MNQSREKEREHSLKKSLLLYKTKQLKSIYILMGVVLLLVLFLLFRSSEDTESFWVQMSMDDMASQSMLKPVFLSGMYEIMQVFDLFFYVLAFVLAFSLFQEFTDRSKLTLFRSLPYTRKQIFGSWFVLGAVPLAAGYVVMAAATGIKFLLCHSTWYAKYLNTNFFLDYLKVDTLGNTWMMILQDFIVCMAIYEESAEFGSLHGMQIEGVADVIEPFYDEYIKLLECKKIPVDAVKKMAEPINLIKITPKEIDFLNSDFKKDGVDSRQHLSL